MAQHSGKTMTFAADLLPHEDGIYNLGDADQKWNIFGNLGTFNGYSRIDITGSTLDLNTLTLSDGTTKIKRYIERTDGGASNITNLPVTGKPFILDVELIRWNSTTDYITLQTFRNANNPANEYVRYCTGGTWGNWTTRVFTDTNKYHKTGSWGGTNNLTYTATAVNSADALAFTLATASTSTYGATKLSSATDSDSEVLAATPKAIKTLNTKMDGLLAAANAMTFKGTIDSTNGSDAEGSTNRKTLPATHNAGDTYRVAKEGTYAGEYCEIGTLIICIKDGTAAADADWTSVETNEDGAVIGPESSTGNNIVTFSGNTGRIIQDSAKAFSTATPGSSSTDAQIPTAKAVWAAINALDANLNSTTPGAGKTVTAFSQTNGKVSVTFGNISITKSQISDFAHDHDGAYLKLDGSNNMTADVNIISGDTDKFVNFWYNTNKTAGASWRIGELGSGTADKNYFVIQSGTSSTSGTDWNNTIRIGANTFDVYLPSTTASTSTTSGALTVGGGVGVGGQLTAATIVATGSNGFTYSGIGNAASAGARPIWFSYLGVNGRPVYNTNFQYNPATKTMTIGEGTLSETEYSGNAASASTISATGGSAAKFWRGDNTWSDTISGGLFKITNNSNTVTIGSQNTSFTHIYNSASIPFIFNNTVLTTSGNLGNTTYPFNNLYIGAKGSRSIYYVGTKATNAMITFLDNTTDTSGNGIKIGGGGTVIVGAGESAANLSVTAGNEALYLTSDVTIYLEAGANTIADRIGLAIDGDGTLLPIKAEAANSNIQDIGTLTNRWRTIYANTLFGHLYNGGAYPNGKTTNPWHCVASLSQSVTSVQLNTKIIFLVSNFYSTEAKGLLDVSVRWESNGTAPAFAKCNWLLAVGGIDKNNFVLTYKFDSSTKTVTLKVYAKIGVAWYSYNFTKLQEHSWGSAENEWQLHWAYSAGEYTYATIPSDETQVISAFEEIKNESAVKAHTHPITDITWAGNKNFTASATANNQEWSIDLTPGSYTGTYWHVWSAKNSKTILACYTDTNNVGVPNGDFSVGGSTSLSGQTTINYTTPASSAKGSSQLQICDSSTSAPVAAIELRRGAINNQNGKASWQIIDEAGELIFRTDYKASGQATTYNNEVMRLKYSTQGATINGLLTATGGSFSGEVTLAKANAGSNFGIYVNHTNPNSDTTKAKKVALMIGGSSGSGGVYDVTKSKWIVYSDTDGDVTLNGNALTADKATTLAASKTIWGQSFNGSANVTGNLTDVGSQIKAQSGVSVLSFLTSGGGALQAKLGRLGLNSSYANADLTNYVLDVGGISRFTGQMNITYAPTGTDSTGKGLLNLTSSAAATVVKSGTYSWGVNHLVTNLASGGNTCLMTGASNGTNNQAVLEFHYHGSNNAENAVGLGLYGNNGLLTINKAGTVKIKATTASTSTTAGALVVGGGIATGAASFLTGSVHIVGSAGGDALVVRGISGCDSTGVRGENVDTTDQGLFLNINGGPVLFGYGDATAGNYVHVQYNQDASSTGTGAFRVSGGVGISKKLYVGTSVDAPKFTATHTAGGQAEFKVQYSTTISYWWGVGTGNENHGLYDDKAGTGKWILSAAADNTWTFDGSVTGHASLDLPLTGGTLTGAVNFKNNTWNKVGDDVQIGDINKAGHLGIQGVNGNTGIFFTTYNQTTNTNGAALTWNGTDLIADKSVQVPDITVFHNANQNVTLQYNSTDDSLDFIFA